MRLSTKMFSSVNIKSMVFGAVIISACFAFIMTGFGRLSIGSLTSMSPTTAAMVDSLSVDMNEFVNFMNQQGYGNVSGSEKKYVAAQVIKQLISQKILANEATKIGWQVSDGEIASAIRTVSIFQDPQTHQFSLSLFKNYIASQQTTEIDFYSFLRAQLNVQKMQNLLYMPIVVPNNMATLQYNVRNTEFNLQYASVNLPESLLQEKIMDKANKFAQDKNNLKQLQDMYSTQKDIFNQKAQIKVRSILVSYKEAQRAQGEALNRSKEEALKIIQNSLMQIKKGKDFISFASSINDDLIAKNNKGEIGFVDDTKIDPSSAKAVAQLSKSNPLSDVVETSFGYRIFQFQEAKPAVNKTFEDVKVELAKKIVENQIKTEEENNLQVKLTEALAAQNIAKISSLLAENNISWQYLPKSFKVTDNTITNLGNTNELSENVFLLKKSGDIIPKIISFDDKKVIIKCVSITSPAKASTQADLDVLKRQIIAEQSQTFAQTTVQSYSQVYEKAGKIKINPIITQ